MFAPEGPHLIEQVVLALSLVFLGFLVIDPFMLERAKALIPEARKFFRTITNIGRSNWMLIPTGAAIAARARAEASAMSASGTPPPMA